MSRKSSEETAVPELRKVAGSNVIELGIEGISATQTLGIFEPPIGFNREAYSMAWGAKEAGTVGSFPSVAELCQPQPHPAIGLLHPGWKVWKDSEGHEHTVKRGTGTLVLLYCEKKDMEVIKKAYADMSKKQLRGVEAKIKQSTLVLPADVRAADDRMDDALKEQMLMAQSMQS